MLFLFNTTICPNEGVFVVRKITTQQAAEIIEHSRIPYGYQNEGKLDVTSAIGHQGSADAFNALFPELDCQVNRIQAVLNPGDRALCLKIIGRLPEGQILTLEELEHMGFEFYLMTNIGASFNEDGSIINSHLGYLTPELNYVHGL